MYYVYTIYILATACALIKKYHTRVRFIPYNIFQLTNYSYMQNFAEKFKVGQLYYYYVYVCRDYY